MNHGNVGSEISFGGYRYCERRRLLVKIDGSPVHIRYKSLAVFRLLARNYNCVVSRAEIFDVVWGPTVVTDDSLAQCICEIRKLLGDRANDTLQTFPRRGYALIADFSQPVSNVPESQAPGTKAKSAGSTTQNSEHRSPTAEPV